MPYKDPEKKRVMANQYSAAWREKHKEAKPEGICSTCDRPRDDPAFKKVADDTIRGLEKSGELEKLYTKWFLSPIPPKNVNMNFAMSETLKELIKNPSDAPAEAYNKKK